VGFFHWRLAFPDVFGWRDRAGGFDAVLGNPPWEQVQREEQKFFATRAPEIAEAAGVKRKRMIAALDDEDPHLAEEWISFVQTVERSGKFMRESGRFFLTARGKLNLYSLFAEHFRKLTAPIGRAGVIVPTGIATDDSNKAFFADIVDQASLAALYDFENRKKIFEAVDSRMKFSLLVMGKGSGDGFEAGFFLLDPAEITEPERTFTLGADDITLLNPNTRTCPIFRSERDAELTRLMYRAAPVLVDESKGEVGNPWGVTFRQGLFNMTSDSHLFRTREELEQDGATLDTDGHFRKDSNEWLPLLEGKLIHQFDHRFATYVTDSTVRDTTEEEHRDEAFVVQPRYWVIAGEVGKAIGHNKPCLISVRRFARNNDVRSGITCAAPRTGFGDNVVLLDSDIGSQSIAVMIACINSFAFDFILRQKLGGTNVNIFILKQLPMLAPGDLSSESVGHIAPRVLELTYTSNDLKPFARELGYDGPPYRWDEERRAQLRAELDGIYAHLYGLGRDDFAYILDTFPIVARKDVEKFGEYRTKRLCLDAYDHFAPETLRALELDVRDIEQDLRRVIVRALDNDPGRLPAYIRNALIEERAKHRSGNVDGQVPPLRELLEASYLPQLSKIVRSDAAWPELAGRFVSKSQFEKHFGRLTTFRNPLAHGRSVEEDVRRKGEDAIGWFNARLREAPT
jgi:hypothetical protein